MKRRAVYVYDSSKQVVVPWSEAGTRFSEKAAAVLSHYIEQLANHADWWMEFDTVTDETASARPVDRESTCQEGEDHAG